MCGSSPAARRGSAGTDRTSTAGCRRDRDRRRRCRRCVSRDRAASRAGPAAPRPACVLSHRDTRRRDASRARQSRTGSGRAARATRPRPYRPGSPGARIGRACARLLARSSSASTRSRSSGCSRARHIVAGGAACGIDGIAKKPEVARRPYRLARLDVRIERRETRLIDCEPQSSVGAMIWRRNARHGGFLLQRPPPRGRSRPPKYQTGAISATSPSPLGPALRPF